MVSDGHSVAGDWGHLFENVAALIQQQFISRFPFKNDGDVSPEVLALRDAFGAFPVPTEVLLVDIEGCESPLSEGRYWTLVQYRLAEPRRATVNFHGVVRLDRMKEWTAVLSEVFGLAEEQVLSSIRSLTFQGASDSAFSEFVEFVPYDVRNDPEKYAARLFESLLWFHAESLIRRFRKDTDFNSLYKLAADPILPEDKLLAIDDITAHFVNIHNLKPPSLQERQQEVSAILLIPQVPESVRRTFNSAKRLYIFAYFEYSFFTVSQHYAYLALEAAVQARWSASLGRYIELRYGAEITRVEFTSHHALRSFCRGRGWNPRRLLVNGRKYPATTRQLLDALQEQGIITKWQRSRVETGLRLRNVLSHLEFASVFGPSAQTLEFVAQLINQMFHLLPVAGGGGVL